MGGRRLPLTSWNPRLFSSESSGFTQYPMDWVWNYKTHEGPARGKYEPFCGDTSEPRADWLPWNLAPHKEVNPQEEGPAASSAQRSRAQGLRIIG